jgi:hypothetical protein
MSSTYQERITKFLTQLKDGAVLTKAKHDGEKYPRHFFLHNHEHFVSYNESEKTFGQPNRCKYYRIHSFFLHRRRILSH